jgi:opacity protein-like surface antigen
MVGVKIVVFAGATALLASAASAADMPMPPMMPMPQVEEFGSGWYLRGDIGMSNQRVGSMFNVLYGAVSSVDTVQKEFDSAPIFGVGLGYQFNNWLRVDVTGEYRGKANFHGLDIVRAGASIFTDEYRASKSEWLVLANAYLDLGTWWHFTPFVGAGVGMSRNTISSFLDVNTPFNGVAFGGTQSKWNFAWALHAGIAYKATQNMTIEFAYRYVSLGDALSGDIVDFTGVNNVNNPMEFRNLTSHDFKLGIRWMLEPMPVSQPYSLPPLMRRG